MNKKFHIHIDAKTEDELAAELKEAAYILTGLNYYLNEWQNKYGAHARQNLKSWQNKANEWMEKHKTIIEE